jgi:hypothetical protein
MNCRACGDTNGRRYNCCADKPVFCNVCKDLHDRRAHREDDLDDDEPEDFDDQEEEEDEDDAWGKDDDDGIYV